jgi:galactose mutarotase-like enzyme
MAIYLTCSVCLVKRPFFEFISGYWAHRQGAGSICLDCCSMIIDAVNNNDSWMGFNSDHLPRSHSSTFMDAVLAR